MTPSTVRKPSRALTWTVALGLVAAMVFLLSQAYPSTEAVRLRNALLIEPSTAQDFGWAPESTPADFRLEHHVPSEKFKNIVQQLALDPAASDLQWAQQLARHLQQNIRDRGPIQADLDTTYDKIVREGYGYCADFTDVYIALALAADIPVRQWGFSFDGFGGHGHAVNEIYDRKLKKWVLLDVFNNFYAVDASTSEPLSALEFRDFVIGARGPAKILPIGPARPGFKTAEKTIEYYRRGAPEWYLWWGNNVYTYDQQPLVKVAGAASRSLEQLAAVATGVYPRIKPLATPQNTAQLSRMFTLKTQVKVALLAGLACGILLMIQITRLLLARRHSKEQLA